MTNRIKMSYGAGAVLLAIVLCLINIFWLSGLSHERQQRLLFADFREQLSAGVAPVDLPINKGTPVAIVSAKTIGLNEVVVEGTSSHLLEGAVGHLRGSALPGQVGTSVLIGKRTSYGGPFGKIGSLKKGDEIIVTSAQGVTTYVVEASGKFAADDAGAFAPADNAIRLVTSAGTFGTDQRLSVLATAADDEVFPSGLKAVIEPVSLDELGANLNHSAAGGLLVWLQVLLATVLGSIWLVNRWGWSKSWTFVAPSIFVLFLVVTMQITKILPAFF